MVMGNAQRAVVLPPPKRPGGVLMASGGPGDGRVQRWDVITQAYLRVAMYVT